MSERSSTLFSAAARFYPQIKRLMGSIRMQWTLEFLELPQVGQHDHGQLLDDGALAKALVILVRMLAQASEEPAGREAVDE